MRLVKAVGALALLAAVLVGVPYALLVWGQPLALLDVDWSSALLRPDDGRIILGLLSVAGWLAWLVLAATTVGELVTTLSRGALSVRLPGTAWLRPVMGALVGAVLAPMISSQLSAAPEAPPPPAAVAVLASQPDEDRPPPEPAAEAVPAAPSGTAYTVVHGDELWSLAERFLGSGDRWREIIATNPGMDADVRLMPGDRILLPEVPVASAGIGEQETLTVEAGDTLWDLADEHLGDPHHWPELHDANRDRIEDPDQIDVGWELVLPGAGAPESEEPGTGASGTSPDAGTEHDAGLVAQDESAADPEEDHPVPVDHQPAEEHVPEPAASEPGTDPADDTELPSLPRSGEPPPSATESTPHRPPLDAGGAESTNLLGPLGAVLAAGIFAGVAARRRSQLLQRAVGRRVLPVRPELQRFWSSLARRSVEADPPPDMGPTGIILGWDGTEDVRHDLESARCTLVEGSHEHTAAVVSATLTSLLCAPWSTSTEVVVVQPQERWEASLDDPRIRDVESLDEGLVDLQKLCAGRRIAMGSATLQELRADVDQASAWAPVVYVFCEPVPARVLAHVTECLALGRVGVSILAPVGAAPAPERGWELVRIESDERAITLGSERRFVPQLLNQPARRAVVELFAAATGTDTEPAPWWDEDPLPPNVKVLPRNTNEPAKDSAMPARSADPTHPTLLLLGPVDLIGVAGSRPSRSAASLECCAWLLAHPGATPSRMVRDLAIAEATRRSNVSRLRSWLGADDEGEPYLPDGYSGYLELHPEVSSDWEQFQLLLSGGVNHASNQVLAEALGLVRGEPLADVSFQWPWAEQIRADMVSMVTDAAAVLADRAIEQGDAATARWAIGQGRLAVGEDEVLAVREIHLFALTGSRSHIDQAVRRLTRSARAAGRDLSPDTVRRIQLALNLAVSANRAN